MERALLLVDDEENILKALVRLLRRDKYHIFTATGGSEGLALLTHHRVAVIVSDQRMPEMTGVEFLRRVKELYPNTVRMVLSGYTELRSVTDAINEGAIYKFLTKPWGDDLLRANIEEAFRYYELYNEKQRLSHELKEANAELARINQDLAHSVEEKTREIMRNLNVLQVSQEILENLPIAVVGIGSDGIIAVANQQAHSLLLPVKGGLVGRTVEEILVGKLLELYYQGINANNETICSIVLNDGRKATAWLSRLGNPSRAYGSILVISSLD